VTSSGNPIPAKEAKPNLALIFGLVFGLGLPLILLSILGLGYYCKVVKGKRKIVAHTSTDTELLQVPAKASRRN
jgi:TM2 domain-containing membrane protein YozV